MTLKVKQTKVIDSFDFDNLVQETYGKIYCFQQQDGCKGRGSVRITVPPSYTNDEEMNESIPELINGDEMGVKFKTWLDRDISEPLNPSRQELVGSNYYFGSSSSEEEDYKKSQFNIRLFWERNFYPDLNILLKDLYDKGLIDEGEYVIEIDW